ncbi:hypothetical protein SCHPADRAFT_880261 [Schizopora paradoxa]|uniref:Uncharacterized protein n=1 Tax=Schizopora paradoxa TaxID=27342 RepID=A0A0H2R9W9_9AGAM|nr:hypothetical protein SCHPADRAFT_880261 [Schizopora paradoxa]
MGGNAFKFLGENAFPRIPPTTYKALKEHLSAKLSALFEFVGTPAEAPEKTSHGDIDIIVANPLVELSGEQVKCELKAQHAILAAGNRTSNFALPSDEDGKFYQVDVHVCKDREEWDRIMFFHSYGDLGMILGVLARTNGLRLGSNGLKVVAPHEAEALPPAFQLSESFPDILRFYGLSIDDWKTGFPTKQAVFEWVTTSRLCDPRRVKDPSNSSREKMLRDREMYQAYLEYCRSIQQSSTLNCSISSKPTDIVREALRFFNKETEYDGIVNANRRRIALKNTFSGQLVMEWTGTSGLRVRDIMNGVRARLSDDEIIQTDKEALKSIVMQIAEELENND